MTTQTSAFSFAVPSVATPFRRHRNPLVVRAQAEPSDKSVEIMRKFSEQYARKSGTYFCVDKGVTSVVIKVGITWQITGIVLKLHQSQLSGPIVQFKWVAAQTWLCSA